MKILNRANKHMFRLLGNQGQEPGKEYREHSYLIREGDCLYNALTNEAVLVEDWEEDREELIRKWFYVPPSFDVLSASHIARSRVLSLAEGPQPKKGLFVIFMTTACNAKCTYCYEQGIRTTSMAEDTAEEVAEYISENTNHDAVAEIRWFGGEPLLNRRCVNVISRDLANYGVKFRSEMFTNGDLLKDVSEDEMKLWNLRSVQLTLDDTGEEYDRIKGLPKGAYGRAKENVERLGKLGIHASLRVHLDPDRGLYPCIKIVDEFKGYENVGMYARLLYNRPVSQEDYDALLQLEDYMYSAGKFQHTFRIYSHPRHCMADSPTTACITTDGHLSPCEHHAFGEDYGTIYSKKVNAEKLREWNVREKYVENCTSCKLYPICKKLVKCPAEGKCSEGYGYYQIESIKRAMRERI